MKWLADLVLVIHALIVLFIVGGLIAIWVGRWLDWRWVRNRKFRLAHAVAICFVALTSLVGVACPLTTLEDWLRAGTIGQLGFIQRWVGNLLYYDFPVWVFTLAYLVFAIIVILTWKLIPPVNNRSSAR